MKALGLAAFIIVFLSAKNVAQSEPAVWADSASTAFLEKLISLAHEYYPDHKVYQLYLNAAEEELFQTKWSWLNNMNLTWQYSPTRQIAQDQVGVLPEFGIGISVNLGSIFNTPSKVRQAEQQVEIAKNSIVSKRNYLEAEVRRRYARYLQNLDMYRIHSNSVDEAELMYKMIKHRFERGEIGLEDFTKFNGLLNDARENMSKSRGDLFWAKSSLEELIGIKLEEVK